jgi:hypothetical protein
VREEVIKIAKDHPMRVGKKRKARFQEDVLAYFERLGYSAHVSNDWTVVKNANIVAGDMARAKYVFTAHYDTPMRMFLPANVLFPRHVLLTSLWQTAWVLAVMAASWALFSLIARLFGLTGILNADVSMLLAWTVMALVFFSVPNKYNANDNTSGVCGVLETAARLPEEIRQDAAFILFDHEEMGLLGSAAYFLKHTEDVKPKLVINLDCIGVGDDIIFVVDRKFAKKQGVMPALAGCAAQAEGKTLQVTNGKGWFFPSDQMNFVKTIVVAAFKRRGKLLYIDAIHSIRDTDMDMKNIDVISDTLVNITKSGVGEQAAS